MLEKLLHFDVNHWVATIGYTGILLIVFLETAVFFCFFLPGDSLVFAAGVLASKGLFSLGILIPALIATAFIGYTFAYWFGDKLGHWLLKRKDSFWFKQRYLTLAHQFYDRHGGKALVLGRLVPIVRTFVPIVAGMIDMPYKKYIAYNLLGALLWGGGITTIGYFIGSLIPNAGHYVFPVALTIIAVSFIPAVVHYFKARHHHNDSVEANSSTDASPGQRD